MTCKCDDCCDAEDPCHFDCPIDEMCQGCKDNSEDDKDREFEEKQALGYNNKGVLNGW